MPSGVWAGSRCIFIRNHILLRMDLYSTLYCTCYMAGISYFMFIKSRMQTTYARPIAGTHCRSKVKRPLEMTECLSRTAMKALAPCLYSYVLSRHHRLTNSCFTSRFILRGDTTLVVQISRTFQSNPQDCITQLLTILMEPRTVISFPPPDPFTPDT